MFDRYENVYVYKIPILIIRMLMILKKKHNFFQFVILERKLPFGFTYTGLKNKKREKKREEEEEYIIGI